MPKCEIFDGSDCHDFYNMKPLRRHRVGRVLSLFSSRRGIGTPPPYPWATKACVPPPPPMYSFLNYQWFYMPTHKKLMRMLKVRSSSWWISSEDALVPDAYKWSQTLKSFEQNCIYRHSWRLPDSASRFSITNISENSRVADPHSFHPDPDPAF